MHHLLDRRALEQVGQEHSLDRRSGNLCTADNSSATALAQEFYAFLVLHGFSNEVCGFVDRKSGDNSTSKV